MGRVPVDMKRSPGDGVLVSWALPRLTDWEKVIEIMDPVLEGQYSMKEVIRVAVIAAMCIQPEADYRPLMADIVQSLVPVNTINHFSHARAQKGLVVKDASEIAMILEKTNSYGNELVADAHLIPTAAVGKTAGDLIK
ncbi:hypothetical protein T459_16027 [Capsicum annuum]|uniref:Serine-threonine/tyrosine-protein kinase catalytic domain-containing protein n=1 Tax=Capsicum annuum TaxID=4072 RepID=A0A2G2Z7Y6_CAPAN|nr:hypothetical protein FXO37_31580 [Capsicum annuum]PHT77975.1 hypothetical protein T459_16027 [Capsicum annuum]